MNIVIPFIKIRQSEDGLTVVSCDGNPYTRKGGLYLVMDICIVVSSNHDDVVKWKHFPQWWPFERWIPLTKASDLDLRLNKRLSDKSACRWFEAPSRSLRRQRNVIFLPALQQGITWVGAVSKFTVIVINMKQFAFMKMHLEMTSSDNFHPGLDVSTARILILINSSEPQGKYIFACPWQIAKPSSRYNVFYLQNAQDNMVMNSSI